MMEEANQSAIVRAWPGESVPYLLMYFYPRVFCYLTLFLALVLRRWALLPLKGGNPFPANHATQ